MNPTRPRDTTRPRARWNRLSLATLLSGIVAAVALVFVLHTEQPSELESWFYRLPAADPGTMFAGATRRKIVLGGERRNGILVAPESPISGRFTVPPNTRMELAFGVACAQPRACRGQRLFVARLRELDTGDEREIVNRSVSTAPAGWESTSIDLAPFTGKDIELTLAAADPLGADGRLRQTSPPIAVWAEPLLARSHSDRPNVILLSIDTLRADRLGCYGYDRPTSPALDQLAGEAVRFNTAISQAPWTTPSHMSMLTSLYPSTHGVNQGWTQFKARERGATYPVLPDDVITLADVLQANGYRTLAMTGGGTVDGSLGFAQGFDVYRQDSVSLRPAVWAQLDQWLSAYGGAPFFLFFHTFQVHAPYSHLELAAPPLTEAQRQDLREVLIGLTGNVIDGLKRQLQRLHLFRKDVTSAMYDGGIRYADEQLGKWFEELRRNGLWEHTVIIVTSDHGEEFAEHDPQRFYDAHCNTLYDELIHVPLIVRVPGRFESGTVVTEQVESIDIAPTVLDLLGIPIPPSMQGHSLVKPMQGEPTTNDHPAMSEATCFGPEWKSVRTPDYKYVAAFAADRASRTGLNGAPVWERLYDLRDDPGEQRNLVESQPSVLSQSRTTLDAHYERVSVERDDHAGVAIADDVKERLRALGYLK